jgi:oxygen-independent coproporphyrinogen-3 oxidase
MQFSPADVFAAGMRHHAIANTAWPIAHGKTMRPYIVGKNDRESHILDGWSATEDMCLYVHVPFCEKICKFCDYSVMNPDIRNEQEPKYFEYLDKELDIYQNAFQGTKKNCIGFDIGG